MNVLFVCLGNICRSPTAEGVFRELVREARLEAGFRIDSAGTGGWHAGELPDPRMREAARRRGYVLESQARQVRVDDFHSFDWILAMDRTNLAELERRRPSDGKAELRLFRDFDPEPGDREVPDPYYGGDEGFEEVMDIVERTSRAFLASLRRSDG
ncbi:MAG: low molecular weight phosphotyrosine protein phosphatase [Myxococcales bacterium]|nr:low molecular weight phosphotyrosine protein phosphatase [Myxococcales bacterium]